MSSSDHLSDLKKNTLVIAIANIGSKAVTFLLAPLYSFYLTTSQYGTMDLITTTTSLLLPFFCLDIYEATFRYSNDSEYDERKVISTSLVACIPGLLIALFVFAGTAIAGKSSIYINYTIIYIILGALIDIFSQYARGHKQIRVFASTGVINSVVLLGANLIFLVLLKYELDGWLISYLIARIATVVYLVFRCEIHKKFRLRFVDREYLSMFIRFCAPLIPTAVMWWVMNASDRYMIAFFLGASFNGIYSVANKIPSILSVFENVFYQAWQTTAIDTLENENRDQFYSNVFNQYFKFLAIGVLALLVIGKPIIVCLFASDYSDAWICLAPLILGILVHALAGNLGSLYSVFKRTKGALYTTVAGALTNIVLNLFFIPRLGIVGAAVTTLIGYVVTLVYRWFDIRKFVKLHLETREVLLVFAIVMVQFALYYFNNPVSYCVRVVLLLFVIVRERKMLLGLIRK